MDTGQTLYVRLATHLGDLGSGLAKGAGMVNAYGAKVDARMASMEQYAKKNQAELRSLGTVAGGVGLAAAAGLGLAIKKFAEFDSQMSAVQAATHASENEMAALRAEAIKLGADTKFSATEAGQGIEELAKAGISTADILGGGLAGALDLAAAGELGVGQAAEIAATALTQFNLSGKDIPHLADLLAAGAGKAQGSVTDLGAALGQSGLIASGMGLSIEETTGSLAAFASAGLIGSDSGTSFKTMIQRLQAPMGRGAQALNKYGISAYDAQGKFVGITNVAGQLQTKLAGLTDQQRDAALAQIFGSDAIRAATVLYKQGAEGIQGWIDKTNDAGYAAETARMRTDNLAGDIERLGGSLDSLLINMGSGANGPMRELVQMLESIVDVVGAVPAPVMSAGVAALALAAAFGITVFAATRMLAAVGQTRANVALLRGTVASTSLPMRQFAANMMLMTGGQAAKGAAILTGVALAATGLGDSFGLSNTATYALMGAWGGPFGAAAGAVVGLLMDVTAANEGLWKSFNEAEQSVAGATTFAGQIENLKQLKDAVIDYSDISVLSLGGLKEGFKGMFGDNSIEQSRKRYEDASEAVKDYQANVGTMLRSTYGAEENKLFSKDYSVQEMQDFVDQVGPILQKAGLDARKVFSEGINGDDWSVAAAAIDEYRAASDTAAGRAGTLDSALSNVDSSLVGTADSASALAKALQGVFSPNMDYDAAIQKYRDGLAGMDEALAKNGTAVDNNSVKSRANREVVRNQVDALSGMMTAAAGAGHSSEYLANMMERGRQSILDTASAAGLNEDAVSSLLDRYGLTPELVSTLIEANGAGKAKGEVQDTQDKLNTLDGKVARPEVKAKGAQATKGLFGSIFDMLNALDGKTATTAIHVNKTVYDHGVTKDAYGSYRAGGSSDGMGAGSIVPRYARGAFNEAHMVRAGVPRGMYGEPETQGESYIPHAMDRRTRSTKILGLTAAKFGYDLAPKGMQAANNGRIVVVQQAGRGPLVGSLTVTPGTRAEVRDALDETEKKLRKIDRGGRQW